MIIAVDGPSASGKGTLARALAAALGYHYLDTGSIYRMVGLSMLQAGKPASDVASATAFAKALKPETFSDPDLRTENVAAMASAIAVIPDVRAALLAFQSSFAAKPPGAVLDGRDIGTVVCPGADIKFFVTASTEVRARRRFDELLANGHKAEFSDVFADVQARDERDATRTVAPTRQADDAILIDTSELDRDEALKTVLDIVREHEKQLD